MQVFLRKLMQFMGLGIESVVLFFKRHLSERRAQKNQRAILLPLAEAQLRKIIEFLEVREVKPLIPNLSAKRVLQASVSQAREEEILKQKGAQQIIDFDIGPLYGSSLSSSPNLSECQNLVKGNFLQTPFRDESFDFLLLFGAAMRRENPLLWMKEIARITKDGARVVISILHPYLEYLLNPKKGFLQGIDQYYMGLRRVGIYVEEIKEIKADETVASSFHSQPEEISISQVQGLPLVVFFKAIRLKKR